jgi:hypothetical protein
MTLTKRQRAFLWIGIVLIVVMCFVPPWREHRQTIAKKKKQPHTENTRKRREPMMITMAVSFGCQAPAKTVSRTIERNAYDGYAG